MLCFFHRFENVSFCTGCCCSALSSSRWGSAHCLAKKFHPPLRGPGPPSLMVLHPFAPLSRPPRVAKATLSQSRTFPSFSFLTKSNFPIFLDQGRDEDGERLASAVGSLDGIINLCSLFHIWWMDPSLIREGDSITDAINNEPLCCKQRCNATLFISQIGRSSPVKNVVHDLIKLFTLATFSNWKKVGRETFNACLFPHRF